MSIFLLWLLITVLPGLDWLTGLFGFLSWIAVFILSGVTCFVYIDADDDDREKTLPFVKTAWKVIAPLAITLPLLAACIPDNDEMKYIVGGYFVTNIETVNELPENIVKSANKFLEDYTGEPK